MTEVLFYHLTEHTVQQALPELLERCLEREWNVVIQAATEAMRDEMDRHLWAYRAGSFLPHGAQDHAPGEPEDHPIWLTTATENPNEAAVRFLLDGATPGSIDDYVRVIYMFDGRDEEAVSGARERWKIEKSVGHELTYWQQDEEGRWGKKA